MNVLILSAAAKVLLVEAFRDAVADRGGRVFAADIAPDSAALHIADRGLILPRSQEPGFIPDLNRVCREHRVGLVVPTRDAELAVLAPWRTEFAAAGTTILVAAPKTIALCQDKQRFAAFCEAESFPIARSYGPDELPARFPIFVRPTTGAGGVGARRIDDAAQWRDLGAERAHLIIQDFVEADEYTVDTLMDLAGAPIQAVARQRLLVRGGEAQKSRVENVPELTELALAVGARLRLVGHNVIQCFRDGAGALSLIEVNPRFGGASNLSIVAGLDSPRRLVELVSGERNAALPRPIRYGLGMLRYSRDVIVEPADIARLAAAQ
ncbi:MAG TPA: ATP-grasp domain-containing protein [Stellaceae bacterium]|jgi:carbamoyl-phosphate synthase large subunit|nr:ATP-grasp domain-containing protein [Stellaceae bacterium]